MKKILLSIICLIFTSAAFADGAELNINIADGVKANRYFFCIYGVDCISIKDADKGRVYPIEPMDVGNIEKFVVTNVDNMEMYMTPTDPSCNVKVNEHQKLNITGRLVVENNKPTIKNLHCSVTAA